ncbi:hypothetical protein ES319_1Z102200v1 [Gossypium barbadense]|uniref:CCT domain-containing protein n=2 Tax=Gossypium TaxID=3633 RepID=A0A5J5N8V4_GOSBA|nr:hypothetical protein ES319_1Z102200v1 [Gossypium barbadense]
MKKNKVLTSQNSTHTYIPSPVPHINAVVRRARPETLCLVLPCNNVEDVNKQTQCLSLVTLCILAVSWPNRKISKTNPKLSFIFPLCSVFGFCSKEMVSTDTIDYHSLFDLPSFPLNGSSLDYNNLQALLNNKQTPEENPVVDHQPTCQNQLLGTQFQSCLSFGPNLEQGYEESCNNLNGFELKNEECQVVTKYLRRNFSFQPCFDPLMASENFQGQALSMPQNTCNGDLENMNQKSYEEAQTPFKVGRYNPEERQERISKYRAKRNQRNFNKTIKYACRKTLADSRPRIRGRFARNDEAIEIPKAACSTRDEEEDDLWVLHEVEDDETLARGDFMNSFCQNQFQYHHGYF